eukprot:3941327-Rhodomonas_salina.1
MGGGRERDGKGGKVGGFKLGDGWEGGERIEKRGCRVRGGQGPALPLSFPPLKPHTLPMPNHSLIPSRIEACLDLSSKGSQTPLSCYSPLVVKASFGQYFVADDTVFTKKSG